MSRHGQSRESVIVRGQRDDYSLAPCILEKWRQRPFNQAAAGKLRILLWHISAKALTATGSRHDQPVANRCLRIHGQREAVRATGLPVAGCTGTATAAGTTW